MIRIISVVLTCIGIPLLIYLVSGTFTQKKKSDPFLSGFKEGKDIIGYPTRLIKYGFIFLVFESLILIMLFLGRSSLIYGMLFTALVLASVVIIND